MEFLGIQQKETVESSTKTLDSSPSNKENMCLNHIGLFILLALKKKNQRETFLHNPRFFFLLQLDSDDGDTLEDEQHKRWIEDRRLQL